MTPSDATAGYVEETETSGTEPDTEVTAVGDEPVADGDGSPSESVSRRGLPGLLSGRVVVFGLLPVLLLSLAVVVGYLKYHEDVAVDGQEAAISSVRAASDGSVALLSYTPENAQDTLTGARDLLTGSFKDSYTSLTNDVVIPGSRQKQISAIATVPAASSVSASKDHAVVLVFVDQTVVIGKDAPSGTASAVQVTLDRVDGRWLISGFDPK